MRKATKNLLIAKFDSEIVPDRKFTDRAAMEFSREKWERMIPQKDVVQSGQEQQEENHGKDKYETDR